MTAKMGNWPSDRGPISKIMPSDGCARDAVPLALERWYDLPEFGGVSGIRSVNGSSGLDPNSRDTGRRLRHAKRPDRTSGNPPQNGAWA